MKSTTIIRILKLLILCLISTILVLIILIIKHTNSFSNYSNWETYKYQNHNLVVKQPINNNQIDITPLNQHDKLRPNLDRAVYVWNKLNLIKFNYKTHSDIHIKYQKENKNIYAITNDKRYLAKNKKYWYLNHTNILINVNQKSLNSKLMDIVFIHELGHVLGLEHNNIHNDVMNKELSSHNKNISHQDKQLIKQIYQ